MKTLIVVLCICLMVYFLGNTDQGPTDPWNNYIVEMFILIAFTYGIIYVLKPND